MKHLAIPAIVCIFLVLEGCKKSLPSRQDDLEISKNTVTLRGIQDSKDTIYVSSNDEWIVNVPDSIDWLDVTPAGGTDDGMFVITSSKANFSTKRRTAIIEVRAVNNSINSTITVVQLQLNESIIEGVFGGEGYDTFSDMALTPDGGYIAVGQSGSVEGDGTGTKGGADFWVVKFDNEGQKVWHKKFGGAGEDIANSVVRTPGNNYIILGSTLSNDGDVPGNKGQQDAWLISIDGNGNLQWQRTLGGASNDWLNNLKPAGDGNYLMSGWTASNDGDIAYNNGAIDAWIVKVNAAGTIIWEDTYGGSNDDMAYDATPVSDGGYVFTGKVASNDGDAQGRTAAVPAAWIIKLNSAHQVGGRVYLGGSELDHGTVALEASNGDYVFAGVTSSADEFDNYHAGSDVFVCRLDGAGNIMWRKAYGGSLDEQPGDLIETDDGGFVFGGSAKSTDGDVPGNSGEEDGWLMRLDGEGNIKNVTVLGGAKSDNIRRIKQLTDTHFAYVGHTASSADGYPDLPDIMHGWFQVITLP